MAIPKVLLFDLGGVLVDFAGLQELPRLLAAPMKPEDSAAQMGDTPRRSGFSRRAGARSSEFAAAFIEEWGLALGRDEFLEEFRSWVRAPYAGTAELLAGLRSRHTLACLSNTNAAHWEKVLQMDGLGPVLDRPFVSHQLGLMKPSLEVYAQVARELGCEPR